MTRYRDRALHHRLICRRQYWDAITKNLSTAKLNRQPAMKQRDPAGHLPEIGIYQGIELHSCELFSSARIERASNRTLAVTRQNELQSALVRFDKSIVCYRLIKILVRRFELFGEADNPSTSCRWRTGKLDESTADDPCWYALECSRGGEEELHLGGSSAMPCCRVEEEACTGIQ